MTMQLDLLSWEAEPPATVDVLKLYIDTAMYGGALKKRLENEAADAWAVAQPPSHEAAAPLAVGDVVVMLGHRLAGQFTSRDGARAWTVVPCDCDLCALGRHVAVDQSFEGRPRHIARAALRRRSDVSIGEGDAMVAHLAFAASIGFLADELDPSTPAPRCRARRRR